MKNHHSTLHFIALILLLIGGLNWGFVGIFDMDIIANIFGYMTTLTRVIYSFIGLSAVYKIALLVMKQR